ncbi:hypothetical protein DASC09_055660 [Saccharomycopsis crataegensis]|uniref:Uncharacterized protein n=1 Tax=Saccharomycopsis crataegensis TaxID=43959 RepID=A0AAV5QUY2_9ASCO|nr:hypothetical protein DASC09_055660 [Saccharomycopsis crataegensis]
MAQDPWAKREAWRYTGAFTRANRFKGAFPGLGLGVGAFAVYCIAEQLFFPADHGHHAPAGEHAKEQHH